MYRFPAEVTTGGISVSCSCTRCRFEVRIWASLPASFRFLLFAGARSLPAAPDSVLSFSKSAGGGFFDGLAFVDLLRADAFLP